MGNSACNRATSVTKAPSVQMNLIYVLRCHHYYGGRVELNTFTLTVKVQMLGLIMVGSYSLQQMKVVCVIR